MSPWPNLFLVGAPRCGTTTLYEVLDEHPDVFMSPNKEPWFYAFEGDERPFVGPGDGQGVRTRIEYEALFAGASSFGVIGEASTLYLASARAPMAIYDDVPGARIVVSLRNPVERAHSNFIQHQWQKRETLEFGAALDAGPRRVAEGWAPFWDYEAMSRYGEQLQRWFDVFPAEQIHVIVFDDLIEDRAGVVAELYRFIGVDDAFVPLDEGAANATGVPKSSGLHSFLRGSSGAKKLLKSVVPGTLRAKARAQIDRRNVAKADVPVAERIRLEAALADDLAVAETLVRRPLAGRWLPE